MRRFLPAVLATFTMMLLLAGPAMAQYPPLPEGEDQVDVAVSDATLVPGEAFTVTGSDWLPASTVDFTLFSDPMDLGSAEVAADTTFSAELEIPESTEPGIHTLEFAGTSDDDEPRVLAVTLEILGSASGGDLASTGTNTAAGLALGGALLIAGATTVMVSRRRQGRVVIGQ